MDLTKIELKAFKIISIHKQSSELLKVIQKFKLKRAIINKINNNCLKVKKVISLLQLVKNKLNWKFKEFSKILTKNSSKDIRRINLKILIKIYKQIIILIIKEIMIKMKRRVKVIVKVESLEGPIAKKKNKMRIMNMENKNMTMKKKFYRRIC